MTKTKQKTAKTTSPFPSNLYVVRDCTTEGTYFACASTPDELLSPGDKAVVGLYRLIEAQGMSADVVISYTQVKK